jgi:hypothetical protein
MGDAKIDTSEAGSARPRPGSDLSALAILAAGAYAAHAWLGDSPYWIELSRRPLIVALRAAALAVDWSQGVKLAMILGTSLWVLRTDVRQPACRFSMPDLRRAFPAAGCFGLEVAR